MLCNATCFAEGVALSASSSLLGGASSGLKVPQNVEAKRWKSAKARADAEAIESATGSVASWASSKAQELQEGGASVLS